jgi:hypothetical protein
MAHTSSGCVPSLGQPVTVAASSARTRHRRRVANPPTEFPAGIDPPTEHARRGSTNRRGFPHSGVRGSARAPPLSRWRDGSGLIPCLADLGIRASPCWGCLDPPGSCGPSRNPRNVVVDAFKYVGRAGDSPATEGRFVALFRGEIWRHPVSKVTVAERLFRRIFFAAR